MSKTKLTQETEETAVAVVDTDTAMMRAEAAELGYVGGNFDTSDVQRPYISAPRGSKAGKFLGDIVVNKDETIVPDGETRDMVILSCSNKYYQEYSPAPPTYVPVKFPTLQAAIDAGMNTEWHDDEAGNRVGPDITTVADLVVLIEADGPSATLELDGRRWVIGQLSAAKRDYDFTVKPFVSKYIQQYARLGHKPWQLVWSVGTVKKGETPWISAKLKDVKSQDDAFVQELEQVLGL